MELEPGWKKYCVSYLLTIYPFWWLLVHSGHEDNELIANEVSVRDVQCGEWVW